MEDSHECSFYQVEFMVILCICCFSCVQVPLFYQGKFMVNSQHIALCAYYL